MRGISSRTKWTIALAATGTVAVASAGIAMGAYALGGMKTSSQAPLLAHPVTRAVAMRPTQARQLTVHAAARTKASRAATAPTSFEGKLSLHDGLVKLKVLRVFAPTRSSQLSWQLLGRKAFLEIGPRVQIRDSRGAQIPLSLVDDAIARVQGRLLPAASWRWSDDELRPVISVRRVVILRLDPDFGD